MDRRSAPGAARRRRRRARADRRGGSPRCTAPTSTPMAMAKTAGRTPRRTSTAHQAAARPAIGLRQHGEELPLLPFSQRVQHGGIVTQKCARRHVVSLGVGPSGSGLRGRAFRADPEGPTLQARPRRPRCLERRSIGQSRHRRDSNITIPRRGRRLLRRLRHRIRSGGRFRRVRAGAGGRARRPGRGWRPRHARRALHRPASSFPHRGSWQERPGPYYPDGIDQDVRYVDGRDQRGSHPRARRTKRALECGLPALFARRLS